MHFAVFDVSYMLIFKGFVHTSFFGLYLVPVLERLLSFLLLFTCTRLLLVIFPLMVLSVPHHVGAT